MDFQYTSNINVWTSNTPAMYGLPIHQQCMELDLHTKERVVAHYSILGITSMYGTSATIEYTGKPPHEAHP